MNLSFWLLEVLNLASLKDIKADARCKNNPIRCETGGKVHIGGLKKLLKKICHLDICEES